MEGPRQALRQVLLGRFQELQREEGLTLRELARRSGYGMDYVGELLRGRRPLGLKASLILAAALGCGIEFRLVPLPQAVAAEARVVFRPWREDRGEGVA